MSLFATDIMGPVVMRDWFFVISVTDILPLPSMMIVWRIRGNIISTVLCCIVYHNFTKLYALLYKQLLQVNVFVCFCVFFLTGANLFVTG